MNRLLITVAIGVLVAATIMAAPVAGNASSAPTDGGNSSAVAPGAALSGAVGVQGAEFEGELDRRTFGIKVARAASDTARATIVADNLNATETRLTELKMRLESLEQARENGSISNDTYRAQRTVLVAQTRNIQHQLNATEATANSLPTDVLEAKGINTTAIRTLKHNASELTGPEAAAIARSIAGPDVGRSIGNGRAPVTVGPPDGAGPNKDTGLTGNNTSPSDQPTGPPDDKGPTAKGNASVNAGSAK